MKLKLNLLIILVSALTLSNLNAQNDLLDSLTKASMEELDPSKEIMIDGITIPVFSVDGKQLSQEEMMQQFMKGDVAPDFYVDNNKDIKAIVLRKATKEEMEMMGRNFCISNHFFSIRTNDKFFKTTRAVRPHNNKISLMLFCNLIDFTKNLKMLYNGCDFYTHQVRFI
jgi:hypothetical protein